MKLSKKRKSVLEKVEDKERYDLTDAINIVKDTAAAKFDESVDAVVNVNLGGAQSLRGTISLPHLFGKEKVVVVFARDKAAEDATAAGADHVGDAELIDKIKGGWVDFDVAIAQSSMMKDVGKLGPVLGRRGLMPSPKNGSVTNDVAAAVKEFKKGKVEFRASKTGVVQLAIGKVSLDAAQLVDNFKAFYDALQKSKPDEVKGDFIASIHVSSTMGIGLKLDPKTI